jgi:uncharacterized protein YqeY
MGLLEKVSEDMKAAMKARAQLRLETLRTLRSGLLEKQVEKRPLGGMTPDDEIAVVRSAMKKRREAIDIYRQNARPDLADQEQAELLVLEEYLPAQMSAADIEAVTRKVVAQVGALTPSDFGKVMPLVMKEVKGKADGKLVQETVRRLLGA